MENVVKSCFDCVNCKTLDPIKGKHACKKAAEFEFETSVIDEDNANYANHCGGYKFRSE